MNIPDYRSAERTFQLITQAAGRAGRGDRRGKVIIQTYEPDNYSLVAAASHDYEKFYKQEIKLRRFMDYPPFTDLIMVNFTAEEETLAIAAGERCKRYMENALAGDNNYKILAPQYSQNFKGKDAVRFYLLIKCPKGERNKYVYYLENFSKILINEKVECNMDLDINPYSTY